MVLPMFVADGIDEPKPIESMPGVVQHTRDSLRKAAADAVHAGVGGLMLFGVPRAEDKDAAGSVGDWPRTASSTSRCATWPRISATRPC